MALLGLLGGFAAGFVGRYSNFCTLGAIEEAYYGSERSRLRIWLLAIGVAIAGTQALDIAGVINLDKSFYLVPKLYWGGMIAGGMIFGFGMALVGTCAFGMLVRAGGGDMRSLVAILVLAVAGYAAANGIFALLLTAFFDASTIELGGFETSAVYRFFSGNRAAGQPVAALVLVAGIAGWALSSRRFVRDRKAMVAGLVIGLVIVYGWWVTGTLGQDPFTPQMFESYRFVRPIGDTLIYMMTFTGAMVTFPIGGVLGVLGGSCAAALLKRDFRFEAFDSAREMRRHLGGAFLMGIGGILALGCTFGEGMSGLSTLSVNSILAIIAIAVGAWLGIRYLIEGEVPSMTRVLARLWSRAR